MTNILHIQETTSAEALAHLDSIDLSMVRLKLADPHEGKGWSQEQLDLAEREYRRFLALHLMYPDMAVVPCSLVDSDVLGNEFRGLSVTEPDLSLLTLTGLLTWMITG